MKTSLPSRLSQLGKIGTLSVTLLAASTLFTKAAEIQWSDGTGSYNNAANWGGTVPGVADKAINDNGAGNVVQINIGDPDWIVNQIHAGRSAGNGAFAQNGQTVYLTNATGRGAVRLGVAANRTGAYTINGGALNYTGEFNVGELGSATLNVNGGSIVGNGNLAINVGSSLDTVTATMGGTNKSDYTWFEQGFYTPDAARGIPLAGSTFTSETLADHSFTMPANYAANNAVQVFAGVTNATITFTSPTAASALSFLGSAGFGTANLNYTVHHADTTTQTGTLSVLDWFDNTGTVAQRAGGRISANGLGLQIINDGPSFPYLLSFDVAIVNTASPVTSVDLTYASGGVAAILAVSSSSGGNFTPQAFTGYNQDIIVEVGAPIYVASTVTDVLNQTAGSINITGEFFVGNYGAGIYNFSGGTNSFQNWFVLGRSGGNGVMNMTGGELNRTGNGDFLVGTGYQAPSGSTPSGVLNHSGGTINSQRPFLVPENSPATGAYNLSGTAVLNLSDWFVCGRFGGSGTFVMTGGTINKTGGGNFAVGDGGGAVGNATHSAGAINVTGGEFFVGNNNSSGTYDLSGTGSITVNNWTVIGRDNGSGVMNISGGTLTKNGDAGNHFIIGASGPGTLNQTAGAVISTLSDTWLGENNSGTWTISGGTASLSLLQIARNASGVGTLNLDGGILTAGEVAGGGGTSTLNLNGGTLVAAANNVNFLHGLSQAFVGPGGAIIDTAGFDVTAAQSLLDSGGGGLTKNGSGTLTFSGANTYTGATAVNGGKVVTTTDSTGVGAITVANAAGLGVKVQLANAQLNAANVTLATSTAASLDFDLGAFGNPTSAPLNVAGTLAVNGTITVNIADALPQAGQFSLIQYGSRTGSGSFVIGSLPVGVVANIVTNGNTIALNITSVNVPRWEGLAGGNWDLGLTTNWINVGTGLPTTYGDGNQVILDDNALGTTTVNLVATVNPSSVTVNNSALNYTLNGAGKISGATGLTKQGTGTLTIANTGGNNYTGPTVISGGTLSVTSLANGGSPSAIGASSASPGNLVLANGTLRYSGPATTINRGYTVQNTNSAIDAQSNLTLSGLATAASGGSFVKTGPAQLAYITVGSNVLSAANTPGYLVQEGTVVFDGSNGGQTNVVQGERLGVNGVAGATLILTNTTVRTAGNLDLGNVANTTNAVIVHSNSTLTVGSWLVFGDGGDATGEFTLNGGTVNVNSGALLMGGRPGALSTLNINSGILNKSGGTVIVGPGNWNGPGARTGIINQSGGTFTFPDEIQIGQEAQGTGIYNLSGGVVNSTGWFVIGRAGGTGTMNMTGGTLTHTSGGQPAFIVGSGAGNDSLASVGVLNHSGGTLNSLSEYWVAENTAAVGTNNISGTAVVNVNNWVSLGRRGQGTINFSGGTFTKTGGGQFILAEGGGTCFWNQSGGALTINNELWIGQGGGASGRLDLSAGTVSVGSWVAVGRAGATGTLNVSGGSFTKLGDNGSHITVGSGGPGTVNQTGGTITSIQSSTFIGEGGQPGVWNISGGAAVLSTVFLPINNGANGTLNLDGGTFSATEITTGNAGGTGTLNFNGGTLGALANNVNFLHGLTAANVLAGGVTVNSGTNTIGVAQALLDGTGGGGLTKTGTGTLNLNGVNTYTGTTLVSAGTLGGVGTIAGPVSVAAGAAFAPGTSIGTLTINNTLGLAGTSTTIMEVSKTASTNDLVTGVTTLTYGGTLVLRNLGGPLAVNDTFKPFNAATYVGSFSSVVSQTPGQTVTWDTSNLTADGTVRVATVAPAPVTLTSVVSGGNLNLSWPADQIGWRLEVQTNSLAVGLNTNWVTVPGSTGVTSVSVPVVPGNPTVFFRLVFP